MQQRYIFTCRRSRWCFMVAVPRLASVNLRDSLLAVLVAVIWGVNFVVIDWGMAGVPPLLFAAIRFTVVLVPAVFLVPRPRVDWRVVVGVGAFMSLGQFGLLYSSMAAGMPAGLAALVLQAQVIFTVVIAAFVLGERPVVGQVVGVALGAAGLLVVGVGRGGHVPLSALLLCLAAALSWGFGNVVARRAGPGNGLGLTVWSALVVPVPLLGLCLAVDGPARIAHALDGLGWQAGVSTLYTAGLSTVLAYSIFNSLLGRHPAARVVPFVLVVPPVAMLSAWLLLDEVPNAAEVVGGIVVLLGVLVTTRPSRQRPLSVYADPTPRSWARAASIRRAVKSAASSRTFSIVRNSAVRISRVWRTMSSTSDGSCTPPSKTRQTASSQPPQGGSQSVSSSGPASIDSPSSSLTSRAVASRGDSPTSTTPPGRSWSRL
jgi:O-acetylserine/cysteine efflux transporter